MTHTHFHCLKPILCCSKKKQPRIVTELYRDLRPVNSIFKRSVVTEIWIEEPASFRFLFPFPVLLPPSQLPWSFRHSPSPPAPLNTSSLPVSWPGLSPLTRWSPWQLAGSGWPQPASDQALWPAGQLSGEAGIQCTVFVLFLRKSCKHIYSRGLFREPVVASRFGARLAEQKKTGRPRLVLPEANKKYCHILQ